MVAAALLAVGCGRTGGLARYELSGQVTYGGKPVPGGTIVFEPDASKGNSGPASYATIAAGQYTTESGQGTVGGPHLVRIAGTDGIPKGELPQGRSLFSEYRAAADLPKGTSTQDFAIPKSHK
jgi:hypothetical protein